MTPWAAAISSGDNLFFAPPDPWVSTFTEMPSRLPAFSRASAAM